jgi:hypothetical protein
MNALKTHQYPLPFKSHADFLGMLRAIARAIHNDCPELNKEFRLIIAGSGSTFYSENPSKQGKFFDKEGSYGKAAGDIDVALACKDLRKIQRHFGTRRPNMFDDAMWGSSCTLNNFPSLRHFYQEWGNHPYVKIGEGNRKRYNRDIGILTFNFDWKDASTYSQWWVKDYVYDAKTDTIMTPPYGIAQYV